VAFFVATNEKQFAAVAFLCVSLRVRKKKATDRKLHVISIFFIVIQLVIKLFIIQNYQIGL